MILSATIDCMKRARKNRRYAFFVAILLVIAAFSLYTKGYRLSTRGITQTKVGEIRLVVPEKGSAVFLDNKEKLTTGRPNQEVVFKRLENRVYTLLVAQENRFPWYKAVDLSKTNTASLASFSMSKVIPSITVNADEPQYQSIKTVIERGVPATAAAKRRSKSNLVEAWIESGDNSIHAQWLGQPADIPRSFCPLGDCLAHIVIFKGKSPIRSLDFFRDRDDVLIVAIENSISALELDTAPPQNFQPIFTGENPRFEQPEDGILFIQNGPAFAVVRY